MKTKIATAALFAAMLAGPSAYAQSVPEGQSCGGLLCDMGVFGHKTAPAPKPAPPPAPVVRAAAPAAEPVDPEPKPKAARKKKRVAKSGIKETAPGEAKLTATVAPERKIASEHKPARMPIATARRASSVVEMPLPLGWETAKTPAAAQAEPPVEAPKPVPAPGSMPVNVINLYSSLPPPSGIHPLY